MGASPSLLSSLSPSFPPSLPPSLPSSLSSNLDQEQLQLAMALSASLHPQATPADLNSVGPGKRGRKANKRDFPPPKLLAISAAESKQRLAQRATDMLLEAQVWSGAVREGAPSH